MSLSRISETYAMLWKMIIRPPRADYTLTDLGPRRFFILDRAYFREDVRLVNDRGQSLACSHFQPCERQSSKLPCVIYVHGNCSSRLEALPSLRALLPRDITVFCLDLSGSGWSDGEYISLGHFEQQDLKTALRHLWRSGTVSAIGLWGRSMGAVTSILRAAEDNSIAACVLDSPFSNLQTVAEELVANRRIALPGFLTYLALQLVRGEVQARAGFDIVDLCPISKAHCVKSDALFGVAGDDTFVMPHHSKALSKSWGGRSTVVQFEGTHNSSRPWWFLEEAAEFLQERLYVATKWPPPHMRHSLAVMKMPLAALPPPRPPLATAFDDFDDSFLFVQQMSTDGSEFEQATKTLMLEDDLDEWSSQPSAVPRCEGQEFVLPAWASKPSLLARCDKQQKLMMPVHL
mmetsp:Transcript_82036/g.145369  ORF Transcript_82036/g.145369 Transcript_82036/m.145369 type:complete len:404 (-) Transcript_82036:167-1378(-)